jgi:hypothetical protein
MNTLLWTLVGVGSWNLLNLVARGWYGDSHFRYGWSIVLGVWAAVLLWGRA